MESTTRTADEHGSLEMTPTATDRPTSTTISTSQTPADELKKTSKGAITIGLFIAATCTALVVKPITPELLLFLLDPYDILLNLSLFIGIGLALWSIKNGGSNSISASSTAANQVVWMKGLMITGITTTFLTLLLRGLMVHSYSNAWYVVFMIIGTAFLYLFMLWMLKRPSANNES
ncbi:hypothetical protein IHE45_05G088800 [Dioscorea alata]|uniref:Uncharacterized protein n=1 Tax=Dioscorea alata TaxID=55571 RepID=A0ACB7W3J8_DIOAL|nr:hypothetical protein IHE45_05G088800 [Dioscorea alata]